MSVIESEKTTLMVFPCPFSMKIFSWAHVNIETIVSPIFAEYVPNFNINSMRKNLSRGNKYISLTVDFTADSQTQLDKLYSKISKHTDVLMVL